MRLQAIAIPAALSAAVMLFSTGVASADQVSVCTSNGPDSGTQTCNLYESNVDGLPSETSSPATDIFAPGSDWLAGYWVITEPATDGSTSDIVWFPDVGGGLASQAILFSDNKSGRTAFTAFGDNFFGFVAEDPITGLATFGQPFIVGQNCNDGGGCDTIIVHSDTDVPEPLTLSLFGAGLLGLGALRRRKTRKEI